MKEKRDDTRYFKELTIPVPYSTAFDICRRSVQMVSDLAVFDADRKSGVIHAGKPDIFRTPDATITMTVEKITVGKTTRITITDTEPFYDRLDSYEKERYRHDIDRILSPLTDFIINLGEDPDFQEPPYTGIRQDPVRVAGQEVPLKTSTPGPNLMRYAPWLFILAGIILVFWGVFTALFVIEGFFQGTWVMPRLHASYSHNGLRDATLLDYLIGPIIPGFFALAAGCYMLMKPGTPANTDTDPQSPTGILVGKGIFYRDPWNSAFNSLIIPGFGQAMNGRADMGLLFVSGAGCGLLFGLVPGILIWLLAVWEAYSTAEQINREEITAAPVQWGMTMLIFVIFASFVILTMFLFSHYGPAVALGLDFTTLKGP